MLDECGGIGLSKASLVAKQVAEDAQLHTSATVPTDTLRGHSGDTLVANVVNERNPKVSADILWDGEVGPVNADDVRAATDVLST
tara:strand:- start:64 stop:318 length:255 start_codon:yes stop_codon:yes gene_type:complete